MKVLSIGIPGRPLESIQTTVQPYVDAKSNKAQALALGPRSTWYVSGRESADQAEQAALEGCQIRYNEPCILAAVNERVLPPAESSTWLRRTMPRVTYSSTFSPEQIPAILLNGGARQSAKSYLTAPSPKATALHAWGRMFFQTNATSQLQAESDALKQCNSDPIRNGRDGPCFLYSVGNHVVLPMRMTAPHNAADTIDQAAAIVTDPTIGKTFSALRSDRALAVEPEGGTYYYWDGASSKEIAERSALAGCQLAYAKPCILLATNEKLQAADPFLAERHDMAELHYRGPFQAEKTPLLATGNREVILGYSNLPFPKALAIRPYHAKATSATGATVAEAESKALASCNDNPKWPCFLYAVNNQVVVSENRTEASK